MRRGGRSTINLRTDQPLATTEIARLAAKCLFRSGSIGLAPSICLPAAGLRARCSGPELPIVASAGQEHTITPSPSPCPPNRPPRAPRLRLTRAPALQCCSAWGLEQPHRTPGGAIASRLVESRARLQKSRIKCQLRLGCPTRPRTISLVSLLPITLDSVSARLQFLSPAGLALALDPVLRPLASIAPTAVQLPRMTTPTGEFGVATPRTQSSSSLKDSDKKDNDWEESLVQPGSSNYSNVFDDPLLAK